MSDYQVIEIDPLRCIEDRLRFETAPFYWTTKRCIERRLIGEVPSKLDLSLSEISGSGRSAIGIALRVANIRLDLTVRKEIDKYGREKYIASAPTISIYDSGYVGTEIITIYDLDIEKLSRKDAKMIYELGREIIDGWEKYDKSSHRLKNFPIEYESKVLDLVGILSKYIKKKSVRETLEKGYSL